MTNGCTSNHALRYDVMCDARCNGMPQAARRACYTWYTLQHGVSNTYCICSIAMMCDVHYLTVI